MEDCGPWIPWYKLSRKAEFFNLYFCCVHTGDKDTTLVLFRNESWFLVIGYMKSQNNRYSSAKNLISIHKFLLRDVNKNGWFAINAAGTTVPILFLWPTIHTDMWRTFWSHFWNPFCLRDNICLFLPVKSSSSTPSSSSSSS